jgi:hypothetical protein
MEGDTFKICMITIEEQLKNKGGVAVVFKGNA